MRYYIYVDNSNLWIEGQYVKAVIDGKADNIKEAHEQRKREKTWKYDFGKLLTLISGDPNKIDRAVLYGSKPTEKDSLWNAAKKSGFEVFAIHRNASNQEKGVDAGLQKEMFDDLYKKIIKLKESGDDVKVILVSGDADHIPVLQSIKDASIKIKIVFWSQSSCDLRKMADEYMCLDNYIDEITL